MISVGLIFASQTQHPNIYHVIERLHRSELADFTTMLSALVDPDGGL